MSGLVRCAEFQSSGHDPSKVFHRKVNKRSLPDYYDVIKEPVALSTLKSKVLNKGYQRFAEFVRDCALIPHNAQTYNRPEAGAYQDAIVMREFFESELKKLAEDNVITEEEAALPDLGEIPPASPRPAEYEEEEDEEDDDEDEDEDVEDSDEDGKKRRRRGPRSVAAITKREGVSKEDGQKAGDVDPRKRRGRPPRVDTPMEARIKAILKGIRKYKSDAGPIMIHQFEKLPDKTTMPEYYQEIKDPIAIEIIKVSRREWDRDQERCAEALTHSQRKQKRKKYQSVDHFMRDIDTMFNNAKSYNQDESQIYKDAVYLQVCASGNNIALILANNLHRKKPINSPTPSWQNLTLIMLWKKVACLCQTGFFTTVSCGKLATGFTYKTRTMSRSPSLHRSIVLGRITKARNGSTRAGTIDQSRRCTNTKSISTPVKLLRRASIVIIELTRSLIDVLSCFARDTAEVGLGAFRVTKKSMCATRDTTRRSTSSTRSKLGPVVCPTRYAIRIMKWICSTV